MSAFVIQEVHSVYQFSVGDQMLSYKLLKEKENRNDMTPCLLYSGSHN